MRIRKRINIPKIRNEKQNQARRWPAYLTGYDIGYPYPSARAPSQPIPPRTEAAANACYPWATQNPFQHPPHPSELYTIAAHHQLLKRVQHRVAPNHHIPMPRTNGHCEKSRRHEPSQEIPQPQKLAMVRIFHIDHSPSVLPSTNRRTVNDDVGFGADYGERDY